MRSLQDYLELPYTYMLEQESDGSYFIAVKELSGYMSVGDTITEAHEMIRDAMETWIEYSLEDGIQIPEPEEETLDDYSGKFIVRITLLSSFQKDAPSLRIMRSYIPNLLRP